jgi:hypothetical protein
MLVTLLLCCSYPDCERSSHSWEPIGGGAYLLHVDGRPVGTYYNGRYKAFLFPASPDRRYRDSLDERHYNGRNGNGHGRNGSGPGPGPGRPERPVIPGPHYEGPTYGLPRFVEEDEPRPRNGPPRNGMPRPRTYETREPTAVTPYRPSFQLPRHACPDRY